MPGDVWNSLTVALGANEIKSAVMVAQSIRASCSL